MRCLWIFVLVCASGFGQSTELRSIVRVETSAALTQAQIPGISVAVLHDGKVAYANGFGLAEVDNAVAMTENSVSRINSITKAFTAVAILQLGEKGKLTLDDHLSKWFPQYTRPGHDPTIAQLLSHCAGLTNYSGPIFHQNVRLDLSAREWVDSVNHEHFYLYPPGTGWGYSNVGYDLLGMIVEKESGISLEDYFDRNILAPVGMSNTGYCNTNRVMKNRASSYQVNHGALLHAESWGTYGNASDRLCSTVLDLGAFLRALDSGKLISMASLQRMRTPSQLANGRSFDYALGTRLGRLDESPLIAYTGDGEEWTSAMVESPSDHWGVIVLCNTDVLGWPASRIAVDILRKLGSAGEAKTLDNPVPLQIRQKITGLWPAAGGPAMELAWTDGHLTVHPAGAPIPPIALVYLGNGRFTFGANAPMAGMEFDFDLADPPSMQAYHNGIFEMMAVRSPSP